MKLTSSQYEKSTSISHFPFNKIVAQISTFSKNILHHYHNVYPHHPTSLLLTTPALSLPQRPQELKVGTIYNLYLIQRPCEEPVLSSTGCRHETGYLPIPARLEYINNTLMAIDRNPNPNSTYPYTLLPSHPRPINVTYQLHDDGNYGSLFAVNRDLGNIDERQLGLYGSIENPLQSLIMWRDYKKIEQPFTRGKWLKDNEGKLSWEGTREWISPRNWNTDNWEKGVGFWTVMRYSDCEFFVLSK
jgi:hypothetical protein